MEQSVQRAQRRSWRPWALGATLILLALVIWLGPRERILGDSLRLVLFHGAWVWSGKIAFALAGLAGLLYLLRRVERWATLSLSWGWVGLWVWSTYLPMSLYLQQSIWGGIFWDEPRWRVPFTLWVAAVLLQAGLLWLREPRLTAALNLVFGVLLWWRLGVTDNVLHPQSPVFAGDSPAIQAHFVALLLVSLLLLVQGVLWLNPYAQRFLRQPESR